jgi:hypothetical protein
MRDIAIKAPASPYPHLKFLLPTARNAQCRSIHRKIKQALAITENHPRAAESFPDKGSIVQQG